MALNRSFSPQQQRQVISWLWPAVRAADIQSRRAIEPAWGVDSQNDAMFVAFAIASVVRGAEMLLAGDDPGLLKFREQVPNAVHVRDIFAHFDKYMIGEGHLQNDAKYAKKHGLELVGKLEVFYSFDGSTRGLHVCGLWLDTRKAAEAANELLIYVEGLVSSG